MSSESDRFSFEQECEVSMTLLADGLVPLSDGVCTFGKWTQSFLVRKE